MSETTGVLAGTITTAALNSAIGYMTPERRARLAHAARRTVHERPAVVTVLAAAFAFLAVRIFRVVLARENGPLPPRPASGASPDVRNGNRNAAR